MAELAALCYSDNVEKAGKKAAELGFKKLEFYVKGKSTRIGSNQINYVTTNLVICKNARSCFCRRHSMPQK